MREARAQRDRELLIRVQELESIVKDVAGSALLTDSSNRSERSQTANSSDSGHSHLPNPGTDEERELGKSYEKYIKSQRATNSRPVRDIWISLSDGFSDFRQILERAQEEDEDESEDDNLPGYTTDSPHGSGVSFLFGGLSDVPDIKNCYPSDEHRSLLVQIFLTNVHPIVTLFHRATILEHTSAWNALLDPSTGRMKYASLESSAFALYFTAVCSLSPEECASYFGETKDVLLERYQRCTEVSLGTADILNTVEVVSLQALVLYTVRSLHYPFQTSN